jgi:hypothetical protein
VRCGRDARAGSGVGASVTCGRSADAWRGAGSFAAVIGCADGVTVTGGSVTTGSRLRRNT